MVRIAIDGPGGAGKSTLAKTVAKRLGIIYVDTGALYRTIGLYMLKNGIDPKDAERVVPALEAFTLELKFENGNQVILLDGENVGDTIRTPEVSMAASAVSAIPAVRDYLLNTQRSIAKENSVIMDGRDIGTVILPDAEVKIFLTASPEARAKRRFEELTAKGIETTYEKVYSEMVERDKNDSTRSVAPCVPAPDAVLLDNSKLDAEGTVKAVLKITKKEEKRRKSRGSKFYLGCRVVVAPIYRLFTRIRVTGKENIPKEGGILVCSNHIGINDVFILGSVFPRQIRFIAKKEWFAIPVFRNLISALGAVSLDRGGKDVGAIKTSVALAKKGAAIAIFPQGHRYPGENPAGTPIKNGAALIAYRANCPVLPVCIKTKDVRYRFLRKIEVIIGKPFSPDELGFENGGYEEYRAATEKIFTEVCRLGDYGPLLSPPESGESTVTE